MLDIKSFVSNLHADCKLERLTILDKKMEGIQICKLLQSRCSKDSLKYVGGDNSDRLVEFVGKNKSVTDVWLSAQWGDKGRLLRDFVEANILARSAKGEAKSTLKKIEICSERHRDPLIRKGFDASSLMFGSSGGVSTSTLFDYLPNKVPELAYLTMPNIQLDEVPANIADNRLDRLKNLFLMNLNVLTVRQSREG